MVIIMDTETGKRIGDPFCEYRQFGAYEEEVLNAEWLPQPALQLGLNVVETAISSGMRATSAVMEDADTFLRKVYLCQE